LLVKLAEELCGTPDPTLRTPAKLGIKNGSSMLHHDVWYFSGNHLFSDHGNAM